MPTRAATAAMTLPFALAAGLALAQVSGTGGLREIDKAPIPSLGMSAGEIEGMEIYGAGGDQIGEIEDVLVDSSGSVAGLVVETEGFLGLGDEDVVLPLGQVQAAGGRLVTTLTEEQLEELPQWKD